MATRKPLTVEVDAGQLAIALGLLATHVAPYTVTPGMCRAVLAIDHDLNEAMPDARTAFDIGWGLRAADAS